ncbi:MAG: hypothetical protein JWM82_2831 [Myxococcales bacterium]|nr:hypothetical protein [Myxococcales bacterium]
MAHLDFLRLDLLRGAVLATSLIAACSGKTSGGTAGTGGSAGAAGGSDGGVTCPTTTFGGAGAAAPAMLVSAPGAVDVQLVLAGGTVYWTEKAKGTVNSIPVAGGTTTVVATAQMSPGPLAVDGASVFRANGDGVVMNKTGTAAATMFLAATTNPITDDPDANTVNALLAASGTLYVGRFVEALKVPTAGGTPVVLSHSPAADKGRPGVFILDPTHLYQTEIVHQAITRETLDGLQNGLIEDHVTRVALAPDRIAVSQGALVDDAIALSGGNVVWADGNNIKTKKVTAAENDSFTVIGNSKEYNPISGFVLSGTTVYLGETMSNKIEKLKLFVDLASTCTNEGTVVASDQVNAGQFAADDTNVYWRTCGATACQIMKMAK